MPYFQGYDSNGIVNGIPVSLTKWSVNTKVDEVDVTTTNSLGFVNYQDGVADADITLEGVLGNLITDDPFKFLNLRTLFGDIHLGARVSLSIGVSVTLNPIKNWIFNSCLVTGWNVDNSVRDVVRWTLMAKGRHDDFARNNPQWTEPT